MNILKKIKNICKYALIKEFPENLQNISNFNIEISSSNIKEIHYQCNSCMKLEKYIKEKSENIAQAIKKFFEINKNIKIKI